jgi:beta-phosphoglucomutase-like phosphatase (HAD superfamily)
MNVMTDLALTGADQAAAERVTELLAGSAARAVTVPGSSSLRRSIDTVLDATALTGLSPVTVSTEEVEAGKPSPGGHQAVVQRLVSEPRSTMLGDCEPGHV